VSFIVLAGILFGSRAKRRLGLSKEEKEEEKKRAGGAPI
jgi:hypothetical protein